MKELGIYVHIPFCKQKCYYCDFVSYSNKQEKVKEYVECLKTEIQEEAFKHKNDEYEVTTVYIGGGTPSFIDPLYIEEILKLIKENYKVTKNPEITIEVNPGTVDKLKFETYKKIGINRISIGLQAAQNSLLKQIGRIHTYEEFEKCYKTAEKVGFTNINVDLMLALPNQTIEDLEESLQKVINLKPNHISLYSLILEEGTKLEKMVNENKVKLPEDELERTMYWEAKHILEKNGYNHYEISNFAKKGYESKHNLNCWKQKEYLGFGAASHSYINKRRYCNTSNLEDYIKNIKNKELERKIQVCEIQTPQDEEKEFMLLGLRTIKGVSIQDFKSKFGKNPIFLFRKELGKLVEEDLIQIDLDEISLTEKGLDLANLVWEEFV